MNYFKGCQAACFAFRTTYCLPCGQTKETIEQIILFFVLFVKCIDRLLRQCYHIVDVLDKHQAVESDLSPYRTGNLFDSGYEHKLGQNVLIKFSILYR